MAGMLMIHRCLTICSKRTIINGSSFMVSRKSQQSVPPSMPRLFTAPSPAPLPNSIAGDILMCDRVGGLGGSGTSRSAALSTGRLDGENEYDGVRRGDLSRQSVESITSEEKKRLLDAKLLRKKADEDAVMMKNRIAKLMQEERRAQKNIEETQQRADEIVRLKAENELKARAKENARMLKEQQLRRDMQQKSLLRAQRDAAIRANRQATIQMKQGIVEDTRREKQANAQATWEFKRVEEERVAKRVQDIYIRDRQVVHQRYRQKHLQQLSVAQSYEQRVLDEERKRIEREAELDRLEKEEAGLLSKLKAAQSDGKP